MHNPTAPERGTIASPCLRTMDDKASWDVNIIGVSFFDARYAGTHDFATGRAPMQATMDGHAVQASSRCCSRVWTATALLQGGPQAGIKGPGSDKGGWTESGAPLLIREDATCCRVGLRLEQAECCKLYIKVDSMDLASSQDLSISKQFSPAPCYPLMHLLQGCQPSQKPSGMLVGA